MALEEGGITLDGASEFRLVKRWAVFASLGQHDLEELWGRSPADRGDVTAFKAFCRACEAKSMEAHKKRLSQVRAEALKAEAKAKDSLKTRLVRKLTERPDYEDLKQARIVKDGVSPAAQLLERNLIAVHLKHELLNRPAMEELERKGIKPKVDWHQQSCARLMEALDPTLQHGDGAWRSHPHQLISGSFDEVSGKLLAHLTKRSSKEELTNRGIYILDTDANYASLVHQIVRASDGFRVSTAQLLSGLSLEEPA
ncbi:unnamed protein product [Discosporangium mesarthrocarpum]